MKTAVIYARYSSERQTEQSIEGQLRACNDYAERNNIVVVNTYIDRAMTGTNDKRTDFQRMLKDSAKKAWDYVIVYKIDRFGRNKYELAMNKNTLKLNGTRLISAMENIPETPEGIILESLLEGMAEYYSAELSQKVRRGMNETRQKGNYTGGFLPYGFKKDGKKVGIDEDRAKVVKFIYEKYAKNIYVKDIIQELTQMGVLNRGKPFVKNTVYKILSNEKYTGVYRYKDEVFTNIYPQIISQDLFNLVREKNESNKYGSRSPFVTYILRKKIKCGYCGRTINGITGTSRSGDVKRYYSCSGRYLKKSCHKKSVRKEMLEKIVMQTILKTFENETTLNQFAEKIMLVNQKRIKEQSLLNLLLQEQDKIIKAKNNLIVAIEQGIITSTTKARLEELELQQDEISQKILVEQTKDKMALSKEDIVRYIKRALKNQEERIIDLLVKKITLYDDKIEITCNYTNKNNMEKEDMNLSVSKETVKLPMTSDKSNALIEIKDVSLEVKV